MTPETTAKPLFLNPDNLEFFWPQVEPLLAKAPIVIEYPVEFIKKGVLSEELFLLTFITESSDGPVVELAVLIAPTLSPILPGMTIVSVVGRNLRLFAGQFWEYFKGWCYMNGARAIDAYVPERMVEFMVNELGLTKETVHVRLRL